MHRPRSPDAKRAIKASAQPRQLVDQATRRRQPLPRLISLNVRNLLRQSEREKIWESNLWVVALIVECRNIDASSISRNTGSTGSPKPFASLGSSTSHHAEVRHLGAPGLQRPPVVRPKLSRHHDLQCQREVPSRHRRVASELFTPCQIELVGRHLSKRRRLRERLGVPCIPHPGNGQPSSASGRARANARRAARTP